MLLTRSCLDGAALIAVYCGGGSTVSQSLRSTSPLEDITHKPHLDTTLTALSHLPAHTSSYLCEFVLVMIVSTGPAYAKEGSGQSQGETNSTKLLLSLTPIDMSLPLLLQYHLVCR